VRKNRPIESPVERFRAPAVGGPTWPPILANCDRPIASTYVAVGKSSLLVSWTDGKFSGEAVVTVGDEEHVRARPMANFEASTSSIEMFAPECLPK
jgi:hypothetical protein